MMISTNSRGMAGDQAGAWPHFTDFEGGGGDTAGTRLGLELCLF